MRTNDCSHSNTVLEERERGGTTEAGGSTHALLKESTFELGPKGYLGIKPSEEVRTHFRQKNTASKKKSYVETAHGLFKA